MHRINRNMVRKKRKNASKMFKKAEMNLYFHEVNEIEKTRDQECQL